MSKPYGPDTCAANQMHPNKCVTVPMPRIVPAMTRPLLMPPPFKSILLRGSRIRRQHLDKRRKDRHDQDPGR